QERERPDRQGIPGEDRAIERAHQGAQPAGDVDGLEREGRAAGVLQEVAALPARRLAAQRGVAAPSPSPSPSRVLRSRRLERADATSAPAVPPATSAATSSASVDRPGIQAWCTSSATAQ